MRKEKLISIIVPVYNTEEYIKRCIDSILKQTYKNLEIICVDDGSSDSSGKILDQLGMEDSRVKVIHNPRSGVSHTRNTALKAATGEYVGFVDSDDYIAPDMYQKMLSVLEQEDADMVTSNYYLDYDGKIVRAENKKPVFGHKVTTMEFLPYIYERDTYKGVAGYLWTRLIKSDLIKDANGSLLVAFEKEFGGADDVVFLSKLYLRCETMIYMDDPCYYYCQRENSFVHNEKELLKTMVWVHAYEEVIAYFKANMVQQDIIDLVIRMYVFRCGKTLELAIKYGNQEKKEQLKEKVNRYLSIYNESNRGNTDRIDWINSLITK